MKKFSVVLKYELKEYFASKGFMIFTIVLALLGAVGLFLPNFIDMSGFTGVKVVGKSDADTSDANEDNMAVDANGDVYYYYDENELVQKDILQMIYPGSEWKAAATVEELKNAVQNQEAEAGFVIKNPTEYEFVVYNKDMFSNITGGFSEAMKIFYRMDYCAKNDLDFAEISGMYEVPIVCTEQILNKDTESNYWYCYALVILVFMLIVLYGQMIAVSVTNEKSNRAIEVLVTSTTSNSLLFGKVIAGAIAGVFQMGAILGSILVSYRINREAWGGMLDMVLDIPLEVILTFATFGLGGYLFYAFLYGAMGALVSKTEDVSKTAGGLQAIIMVVYIFALVQLTNVEGPIIKVLSFLPISSYSTMFARIAMGTVATWEIILSFVILVVSTVLAGILGAKLYRMGTLRYGNPIKLSTALKDLKKNK